MVQNFPPEGPCVFWAPEKHQKSCALISKIQRFNSGSYGPRISNPVDTKYVFFNLSITKSKTGMRQRWPCSCLPLNLLQWTYLSGRRNHRDSIHHRLCWICLRITLPVWHSCVSLTHQLSTPCFWFLLLTENTTYSQCLVMDCLTWSKKKINKHPPTV